MRRSKPRLAKLRRAIGGLCFVAACAVPGWLFLHGETPPANSTGSTNDPADPNRVVGHQACTECHAQEATAFRAQWHFTSHQRIRKFEGHTQKYCEAMGIDVAALKSHATCWRCHATAQTSSTGHVRIIGGVTCESCHGAAGGSDGWLNVHASLKPSDNETAEHRQQRIQRCREAGMIRPGDLPSLARKCLGCHLLDDPQLFAVGHPLISNGFELAAWTAGEIRHNFHVDPKTNSPAPTLWTQHTGLTSQDRQRVKYVVGTLVELELCLRHRSKVTLPKDTSYAEALGGRIAAINAKLIRIASVATELNPLVTKLQPVLIRLFDVKDDDDDFYQHEADAVAKITEQFFEDHDGTRLTALDQVIEVSPPKGKPFHPSDLNAK